jgi:hypothetical protein
MNTRNVLLPLTAVAGLLWASPTARAEIVRFHYVPEAANGVTVMRPSVPCGERVAFFGRACEPYCGKLTPNCVVTFCHAYTGQKVNVPMALPEGTPTVQHVFNRVVYAYTSYTVQAVFRPDGSVDVVYNSGPLRPI